MVWILSQRCSVKKLQTLSTAHDLPKPTLMKLLSRLKRPKEKFVNRYSPTAVHIDIFMSLTNVHWANNSQFYFHSINLLWTGLSDEVIVLAENLFIGSKIASFYWVITKIITQFFNCCETFKYFFRV